jgi:threonine dehydrogenase-like Zn-dependent dehydrogenase
VPALPDDSAVLDDDGADHRIGAHAAHATLGELDGPREVLVIGLGPLH